MSALPVPRPYAGAGRWLVAWRWRGAAGLPLLQVPVDEALDFLARYQVWILGLVGLGALLSVIFFWLAYQRHERTPFGLEKDAARRRQNVALAALSLLLTLGAIVFGLDRYIVRREGGAAGTLAPDARPTEAATPTPILGAQPLVVDSSGCDNPAVNLVKPGHGERIAGSYEIVGTANIPNFAFYKVEISSAATNGAWVTLAVGNVPKSADALGRFDTSPYEPGEYAFRLVATDNVGRAAPPCVIVVSFAPGVPPTAAAP